MRQVAQLNPKMPAIPFIVMHLVNIISLKYNRKYSTGFTNYLYLPLQALPGFLPSRNILK